MNSVSTPNIFQDHLLQKRDPGPLIITDPGHSWPSLFLILCLVLLVFVKNSSFQKVKKIIQSTFSTQKLQQLEREEANTFKFYAMALRLFFILNISFLIYKMNSIYRWVLTGNSDLTQFLFFFAVIFLFSAFKSVSNRLLAFFTGERKVIGYYTMNSALVNQTFGLFLFPWLILAEFSIFNPLVFISCAIIVLSISVLLKWYRGFISGLIEERIGLLQIFSYFCGLEILPIFVLVKFIIETF